MAGDKGEKSEKQTQIAQHEKQTQIAQHDPLFLHASDGPNSVVIEKLKGSSNYKIWKRSMEVALASKRKLGFVTGAVTKDEQDPVRKEQWETCNSIVVSWLHNCVTEEVKSSIIFIEGAKEAWKMLETLYNVTNGVQKFKIERQLFHTSQDDMTINEYYVKMKALWQERDAMRLIPAVTELGTEVNTLLEAVNKEREEMRLFQFLNGVDELYAAIRTQMLMTTPLPTVEVAFGYLMQEELQRDVLGTTRVHAEGSAMYGNSQGKYGKFGGRQETSDAKGCQACGKKGHSKEACWSVVGYPKWHPKAKKQGENPDGGNKWSKTKGKKVAANAVIENGEEGKLLTSKQIEELLRLIPSGSKQNGSDTEEELESSFAAVVTELIEGLVETYPGLQYLDGFPEVKVVLRADVSSTTYDKVSVISGGGSGHEPAHAGFVGEGMLTAAICGDIFASPPVDSILAGIRAVTGQKGCLLIVKNYTGDRLNFGLAAEQAKSEGYKVEMVIVGDDCALPPRGIAGRRGLAGTILVHKVAGAAAAAGCTLSEVTAEARRASEMVGTMGVALSVCTLPGQVTSDRLGPGKMELGLGIHGEPGAAVADLQPTDVVVAHVLMQILSPESNYVPIERGNNVVVMINGLGATPVMELMIATGKAVPRLQLEHGLAVDRVYTGSFMTSLDMAGWSITVMKVDEAILQRLDAPTKAPAWPVGVNDKRPPTKIPVPVPQSPIPSSNEFSTRPEQLSEHGLVIEVAIEAAASELMNIRDTLNEWDSKVGDGDCGSTMFRGASAILQDMKKHYPLNDVAETLKEIGSSIRRVMGGTSGILYEILFRAAYAELKSTSHCTVTSKEWASALHAAIAAVSKYGGASAGYRTLLDALIPAANVLQERLNAGDDPVDAFVLSSEAALSGAESTKNMHAQAGRSSYVSSDLLSSVPDPGAMALASWYKAAALAVQKFHQVS